MNWKILKRLFVYVKPLKIEFIINVVSGIIGTIFAAMIPVIVGNAIDLAIGQGNVDFNGIFRNTIILFLLAILCSVFQWMYSFYGASFSYKLSNNIRDEMFKRINYMPLSYMDTKPHGDIVSRMINDLDAVSEGVMQFNQVFSGIIMVVGTIVFMMLISVKVSLMVIILTPLFILVSYFIVSKSYIAFRSQAKLQGDLTGYTEEMISQQKIVSAFKYEKCAIQKFGTINEKLYKSGVDSQFYSSLTNPSIRFVSVLIYALVGVYGAMIVLGEQTLTIGQVSSLLIYVNQYTRPFIEITSVVTQLQSATAALQRVFNVLDENVEEPDKDNPVKLNDCKGNVSIENLYFSYTKDTSLIEDFNLEVKSGQKIAIVGPTGCGKTTIINLLMRFYEPTKGQIKIDGIPIRDMTREDLRNLYGMVLQDTWLYSGTVRDNIAYGCESASDEKIIEAAKAANADNFIRKLEHGYNTILLENGVNISQGQKQLLCIARVMMKDPKILILDEATSNIDTRTEQKVQEAFDKLMKGRTSFVVAHRLSTIRNADIILVMNNGNIIEKGSHDKLIQQDGFYSKMYYSQFEMKNI